MYVGYIRGNRQRFGRCGLGRTDLRLAVVRHIHVDFPHMGIGEAQKRADVVLVEPERSLKEATSLPRRLERQGLVPGRPAVEGVIKGIEAFGMLERCAPALCGDEFDVDGTGQSDGDLFLRVEEVGIWFVEAFGPKMRTNPGVDELGIDPHQLARALHAAFEYVTHAELETDL